MRSLPECPERHHVEVGEELTNNEMPPRLENPLELPQSEVLIRYFAKDQRQVSSVEGSVGIWESTSISPRWGYILDATLLSPVHHMVEHLLLDVQNLERAARIQPLGDRQG